MTSTPPRPEGYYWIVRCERVDEETETQHFGVDIAHWNGAVWCSIAGPDYDWDDETDVVAGPLAPPSPPPPEPITGMSLSLLRWRKRLVSLASDHPDWSDDRVRAEAARAYPEVRPHIALTEASLAMLGAPSALSDTRHTWVKKWPPGFHVQDCTPPREWWQCAHCRCIRIGDPLPESTEGRVGGAHLVWNKSDFCGTKDLDAARDACERSAIGAGIESLGAFLGARPVGHLFRGDE